MPRLFRYLKCHCQYIPFDTGADTRLTEGGARLPSFVFILTHTLPLSIVREFAHWVRLFLFYNRHAVDTLIL